MSRILKRPQARQDLLAIWEYIAEDNPLIADSFLDKLEDQLYSLADSPLLGRERPELHKDIRSFVFRDYNIYYIAMKDGIELVRVIHGSRDIPNLFQRRI